MKIKHISILAKLKKARTIGGILVIFLTILFFTRALTGYYQQLQISDFSISPFKVLASFLLFVCYLTLRALSWGFLVRFLGDSINKNNSLSVWFFSEVTRYIPGNIWSFAVRAYLARMKKISENVSLLVLPIEVITVATVTSVLSLYAIIKNLERLPVTPLFFMAVLIPPLVLAGFILLQKVIKRLLGKLFSQNLNLKALLRAILLQLIGWSLYSAGAIVLVGGKVENSPLLFSSTLLAWLIGYLSLITPMGLGVRESAFVLLTGNQIGTAQAIVIAIASRLILIVAEITILAFMVVRNRFVQKPIN